LWAIAPQSEAPHQAGNRPQRWAARPTEVVFRSATERIETGQPLWQRDEALLSEMFEESALCRKLNAAAVPFQQRNTENPF
jgi:hypothetical protein